MTPENPGTSKTWRPLGAKGRSRQICLMISPFNFGTSKAMVVNEPSTASFQCVAVWHSLSQTVTQRIKCTAWDRSDLDLSSATCIHTRKYKKICKVCKGLDVVLPSNSVAPSVNCRLRRMKWLFNPLNEHELHVKLSEIYLLCSLQSCALVTNGTW